MDHTEHHESNTASDSRSDYDALTQRLPGLRRDLLSCGLVRVIARYERAQMKMVLLAEEDDNAKLPPHLLEVSVDLCAVFEAILARRYPKAPPDRRSGDFDWDLIKDLLVHRHVLVVYGL